MAQEPRGWNAGATDVRFADVAPQSFNKKARTVDAVISMGTPVKRFYGTEILRIDPKSVILDRMAGGIPLLDSHSQASITDSLGRITETWFNRGALLGKIKFNETPRGEMAMGMVERKEVAGLSAGYKVEEWEIADAEGRKVDPEMVRWDDDLTFTATRWELLEASLVCVPAEGSAAGIRSLGSATDRPLPETDELARRAIRITKRFGEASITYELPDLSKTAAVPLADIRARMESRQNMHERMVPRTR